MGRTTYRPVATDVMKLTPSGLDLFEVIFSIRTVVLFAVTRDITSENAHSVVTGDNVRLHLTNQVVLVAERWVTIDASALINNPPNLEHVRKTSGAGYPPSRVPAEHRSRL